MVTPPPCLTNADTPQKTRQLLGERLQTFVPRPPPYPLIMGIINVTPNSFSDGGDLPQLEDVLRRAGTLKGEGADILDVGGASSHPNAPHTPIKVELQRVVPVVKTLHQQGLGPISIDTQHPAVAQQCLHAGAHLINDVSGLCTTQTPNADMAAIAAQFGAPLVITCNHLNQPPPPNTPLLEGMLHFFKQRITAAKKHGATQLILDPGYGFGKSLPQNLQTLRELSSLIPLGYPILTCTSRKGSLGKLSAEPKPKERLGAGLASAFFALKQGASIVRTHDVKPLHQFVHLWHTLR